MRGRASVYVEIRNAVSALRKRKRSLVARITRTGDRICPNNTRAIGWVRGKLFALIFEIREDDSGEFYHLVTLWRATREEQHLYEENS